MNSPIREEDSYVFIIIVNIRDFRFNDTTATRMLLKKSVSSFSLNRDYSYPLTLSNVQEPSRSLIPWDHMQVQKKKYNFVIACLAFSHCSLPKMVRKNVQKMYALANLLFWLLNLLFFRHSHCRGIMGS